MTIAESNLLLFQVGPVPCCVDSNTVQIVIEPPAHITAIPGNNAYRPGLMVYAKRAVSVYDVRTKFNLSTDQRGKIIISEMGNQLFGFWVDSIQAVMLSSEGKWQLLPPECPKELFEAVFMFNNRLIFKTSFDSLAKAQVNTQILNFINKLLDEEKKNKEIPLTKENSSGAEKPKTGSKPDSFTKHSRPASKSTETDSLSNSTTTNINDITKVYSKDKTSIKHVDIQLNANRIKPKNLDGSINKPVKPAITNTINAPTTKQTAATTISRPLSTSANGNSIGHSSAFKTTEKLKQINNRTKPKNNTSQSTVEKEPKQQQTDQESSGISGLILILILIAGVPGLSWYLFFDDSTTTKTQSIIKNKPPQLSSNEINETLKPKLSTTITNIVSETNTEEQTENLGENHIEISESNDFNETNINNEIIIDENKNQSAQINHKDDTIIITINDSSAAFNEITQDTEKSLERVDTEIQEPVLISDTEEMIEHESLPEGSGNNPQDVSIQIEETTPNEDTKANLVPSVSTNKIIHIIVKGDTLWHIAKRYIHDPFKYPQLARLSKIKNPDLIYPGNKVIIIIKNHRTK